MRLLFIQSLKEGFMIILIDQLKPALVETRVFHFNLYKFHVL